MAINKISDAWHGHAKSEVREVIQSTVSDLESKFNRVKDAYVKPEGGIPKSDLSTALQADINNAVTPDGDTGKINWADLPCVVLASMGSSIDGSAYTPQVGDTYYNPTSRTLVYYKSSGPVNYPVASGIIYYNKRTDLFYRYDEAERKMKVVGDSTDVDLDGKADLLNLSQGGDMLAVDQWPRTVLYNVTYADMDYLSTGSIYFDVGDKHLYYHGTNVDIDLGSPSTTAAYLCTADNMFYRWNGTVFVDAGLQPSGGMSEESLRRNIQIVQNNVDTLRASLANSAFSTARPTLQALDWDTTQVCHVTLVPVLEDCEIVSPMSTSLIVAPGGSIEVTINPTSGNTLSTTNAIVREGANVIGFSQTHIGDSLIITIPDITRDMRITIAAKASAMTITPTDHSVSLVDSSSKLSLSTDTVADGTTLVVTLTVTDEHYELPTTITVTDGDGNALEYTYVNGVITVYNVNTNVVITAAATPKTSHTVSVSVGSNILVYDSKGVLQSDFSTGTFTVWEGDDFDLYILPADGYKISSVTASLVYTNNGNTNSVAIAGAYNSTTGLLHIDASKIVSNILVSASATALTSYTLTQTLTGCTSSSEATSLVEGSELYVVLTPTEGYSFNGAGAGVAVTMGSETITSKVWDATTNTVFIRGVRGNVVITATAVSASSHTVTYTLSNVTKVSGATSITDGGTLTAVLQKGSGFTGVYGFTGNESATLVYDFAKRDVLVYMGGARLVEGEDFTMTQAMLGGNVSISIPNVTGDVTIMNIEWALQYLDAEGTAVESFTASSPTTKIPIPSGCAKVGVMPNFDQGYNYYTCLYNGSTFVSSHKPLSYLVKHIDITSGVNGILPSFYTYATEKNAYGYGTYFNGQFPDQDGLNYCYIYDETNGKFIWKGDLVTGTVSEQKLITGQNILTVQTINTSSPEYYELGQTRP